MTDADGAAGRAWSACVVGTRQPASRAHGTWLRASRAKRWGEAGRAIDGVSKLPPVPCVHGTRAVRAWKLVGDCDVPYRNVWYVAPLAMLTQESFPGVPLMALTATATERVAGDVLSTLRIPAARRFKVGWVDGGAGGRHRGRGDGQAWGGRRCVALCCQMLFQAPPTTVSY